jgi:hypothetical protein
MIEILGLTPKIPRNTRQVLLWLRLTLKILPRNWQFLAGPMNIALNSEYVGVHSANEELLGVHVDVIPKPIDEARQKKLERR